MFTSKRILLETLGIKENYLYLDFSNKYTEKHRPKKNGGYRKIKPPIHSLKLIQRQILDKILTYNNQLECVHGLSKVRDLKANVTLHKNCVGKFLLNLDIENFFPSISQKKVLSVFKKIGFSLENAAILTKLCTIDKSLPQGAPTSPYLASLACQDMDKKIYNYCRRRGLVYSRYFDDISISGEKISGSQIMDIKRLIKASGLKCNNQKTHLFTPADDTKIINGVLLKSNQLTVPDEYKRDIEVCYQNLLQSKTIQSQRVYNGKVGFYLYINKKEATSYKKLLENKYGTLSL